MLKTEPEEYMIKGQKRRENQWSGLRGSQGRKILRSPAETEEEAGQQMRWQSEVERGRETWVAGVLEAHIYLFFQKYLLSAKPYHTLFWGLGAQNNSLPPGSLREGVGAKVFYQWKRPGIYHYKFKQKDQEGIMGKRVALWKRYISLG